MTTVSELRVVLLGGSLSQRRSVGNFILGDDGFSRSPNIFRKITGRWENKQITVINTPDKKFPTPDNMTEFLRECVRLSDPGPHVFLLVLQPEDFTEREKNRIYRILQSFSDQSLDHSLVLTLEPKEERSASKKKYIENSPLKDLIRECRYRDLSMEDIELPKLLTRVEQIIKENDGEHVRWKDIPTPFSTGSKAGVQKDDYLPMKRCSSLDLIPPSLSEMKVVLLGARWSQRDSVRKLILGGEDFTTEPNSFIKISKSVENKQITVINTPDLQFPTADKLTEFNKECAKVSDPGPHVFLLVLQPEDFTEEEKNRISKVLYNFNDESFDHSLVFILTPRQESLGLIEKYMKNPPIMELIRKCRNRYVLQMMVEAPDLLACFDQIVKKNNREHVSYDEFEEEATSFSADYQSWSQTRTPGVSMAADEDKGFCQTNEQIHLQLSKDSSAFRIVLLGEGKKKKIKLVDQMIRDPELIIQKPPSDCEASCGKWRGKPVTVVKFPHIFSLTEEKMRAEVKSCKTLCYPGPNVLLLLVNPSDFYKKHRNKMNSLLSLFGQEALKHSIVVITHEAGLRFPFTEDLIYDCGGRCHEMLEQNYLELMMKIEDIMKENKETFSTSTDVFTRVKQIGGKMIKSPVLEEQQRKPPLNLVLFGWRAAGKASAAKAILGQTDLGSASNPSECVRKQGEVCGRWVSLVELPALDGKAQQEVMEESFRCISLCDPEGVHAFILVLPVGPLTDEDKGELQTIQDTFSSRVNDFTMILFTEDSDPTAPPGGNFVKENKDIQELCQRCGGRYVVLNMKDRQQIPELMEMVERSVSDRKDLSSYTTKTLAWGHIEEKLQLQAELKELNTKTPDSDENATKSKPSSEERCDVQNSPDLLGAVGKSLSEGIPEGQSVECLRIVLVGKTGSGKSSSGNTILGRKEFIAAASPQSVTKKCEKAQGEVDGRPVVVVDTPGLFDNNMSSEDLNEELLRCFSLVAPGPHVFLLITQIGRFTEEDGDTFRLIEEVLGENYKKFTIILFTKGDYLEQEEMSVKDYIEEDGVDACKKLINECGGRYHVFNNYDKKNHSQISELIRLINTMVKDNKGSCYTRKTLSVQNERLKPN